MTNKKGWPKKVELLANYHWFQTEVKKAKLKGLSGKGTKIAVLDTGCNDVLGAGFELSKYSTYNAIADSSDVTDGNDIRHGTRVASMIVSHIGFAPAADLAICKVISDIGVLNSLSDFEAAINYAIAEGVHAVNMSFKIPLGSAEEIRDLLQTAVDEDIVLFCASGNDEVATQTVFPACLPQCVAVGSIDIDGVAQYKNWIKPATGAAYDNIQNLHGLDFMVGGYGHSTIAQAGVLSNGWGTSFSSPIAAAMFACYREANPGYGNYEILQLMKNNCQKSDPNFGSGLLQF